MKYRKLGDIFMKQKHIEFLDDKKFENEIENLGSELKNAKSFYFQIFSSTLDTTVLENVIKIIQNKYPNCLCIANSTAGNIVNSNEGTEISVICNIFEKKSSKFEVLQYDFGESGMSEIALNLKLETEKRPWIKALEIYHTVPKISTSYLCDELANLEVNVKVFGGIVCSSDIASSDSFIYSTIGGKTDNGLLCVFIGGDDLYVDSIKISGWKPIGRTFRVTKVEGNILKELSGIPAYEIYKKYLNIQNDNNFFINALDFPMMYEHNNTTIVRAATSSNEDGSVVMSANVENDEIIRLSYGEPKTIIESIYNKSIEMQNFKPQVMHIFSCAARKAFWSSHNPTYELKSLKSICESSGFFSHGEFLREKGLVNQHNLTLVIALLREGEKSEIDYKGKIEQNSELLSSKMPLAARMATFIKETSYELEQINSHLEVINNQLKDVATTDGLTGLDNRLAFNDMLKAIEHESCRKDNWIMYMFDVNGLKYINDTFGHPAGDELIKSAANVLKFVFGNDGHCFRIGGDEFVILIDVSDNKIRELEKKYYEKMLEHNRSAVYHLSIAKGKSRLIDAQGIRRSISDWKMDADLSMYRNKAAAHKERKTTKDENLKQLISCLITVEEAKDPYTAYHSDRVFKMSEMISKKMGLTEETINMISDAATLHDIGKVGISDSVLLKPGRLTDSEFEQIKKHPVIGAKILMKSNYMQEFVQIVLHHHERYDGRGYPDQLVGDNIPLGARIIAIADSIDAMTSKRIYRDALPLSVCKEEIEKNVGKMYDPAIAKLVLENWGEIEEIVMAHPKNLFDE